ncbi:MAG: 4Fe-4S binding protein [Fidelibacterota bacterium]|nr:MAG: 4Fe-4S binding protein [Candidatus Neomarinimicrobiota bacterium]
MSEQQLVTLSIDGQKVEAEKGTTLVEVGRQIGVDIPTLCYHQSVRPHNTCRICCVELVKGEKRTLVPACIYPAREGLQIFTETATVQQHRKSVLERLAASCPDIPSIQELASRYGVAEPYRVVEADNCIACGLCARMCEEVVQAGAIKWDRESEKTGLQLSHIDTDRCIVCGACASVCPTGKLAIEPLWKNTREPREFTLGPDTAVFLPTYQAVPKVPVIDREACIHFKTGGCRICEQACEHNAIDHQAIEKQVDIEVGQILLATGFDLFNARSMAQYGYGIHDNVYTSLEVEHMLNASGPTGGQVLLKDGRVPQSIGILHCIGSRDERHNRYCSRVCCMYALKYAHLVKERTEAEVYQFYIDMRAFGKGYEEFYGRILDENVNVVRGKVAEIVHTPSSNGSLVVRCEDTLIKKFREIPVEMIVLCNALEPQHDGERMKQLFSISTSADGFFLEKHPKLDPTATATDGIYIAGCCQGPKDIPDTVAQASSAAARILATIARGEVEVEPIQAVIRPELCSGCRTCNQLCPYHAIFYDQDSGISIVNEAACKGCGTCVAACPSSAATASGFTDQQIFAEIEGLLVDGTGRIN